MNAAIGHRGRQAGGSATPSVAVNVGGAPVGVALMFRFPGVVSYGLTTAVVWLATMGMASSSASAATLSLLPQPVEVRLAGSGVVRLADGAPVAVHGVALQRAQLIRAQLVAGQFMQLVARTRGLQLHPAASGGPAGAHPAITFEVDPKADVVGDSGYRIVSGPQGIRVITRSPAGAFYGGVTLWQLMTPPGWSRSAAVEIPQGVIEDHPRFAWRALLLDSGRHFQSVAEIEKLIEWMSLDKLNVLLWHLTEDQGWRLEIPKYRALTKIGACRKAVGVDIELAEAQRIAAPEGPAATGARRMESPEGPAATGAQRVESPEGPAATGAQRVESPEGPAATKAQRRASQEAPKARRGTRRAGDAPEDQYCGFYSEAEVREIVRYAATRFVTVVPEIDLPGHSQAAVAAYPWLGVTGERPPVWTDWGISPWLLKPDEKTLQFVDDVLDEVMQLFPSRYISIGGDEADKQQWNASPEVNARMRRLGLANMDQLQGWFTGRIADYLIAHGRTPVGWDDELVAGAKLPASEVVMSWHGNDEEHVAREAAAQGHDVILTPQESLYFDHYQSDLPDEWPGQPPMVTLRQAYDTAVIPSGATAAEASHVIGVQGDLWTELMPSFANDQHAVFPRIAALSELGWSAASTHDWNRFLQRLPAELARYRALGINYADTAFAPAFEVTAGGKDILRVAVSNQANFGDIRYTTDGSAPTSKSARYVGPLEFPERGKVTLRAATFGPDGFDLAAPRTQVLDGSTLLSRDGSELATCSGEPGMRVGGGLPPQAPRPVYKADIGNMCWLWRRAPLHGIQHVMLTVGRVVWRFGDEAKEAVARPKAGAAGELEIHADSCTGPLLARLPLPPLAPGDEQKELNAPVSPAMLNDAHDLCVFATGDPREGQWVLARVALSNQGA